MQGSSLINLLKYEYAWKILVFGLQKQKIPFTFVFLPCYMFYCHFIFHNFLLFNIICITFSYCLCILYPWGNLTQLDADYLFSISATENWHILQMNRRNAAYYFSIQYFRSVEQKDR